MKKTYITVIIIAFLLGGIVAILPPGNNKKELSPELLLQKIIDDTRFFSADEVAHLLISGDPSILLIDVRTPDEFAKFALPGAINIPLDSILNEGNEYILNQKTVNNIFYSNGTIYANQAWVLTSRLNYSNNYVLDGGLNNWIETIILPVKPDITESKEIQELYEFRKAAMKYFTGGSEIIETETPEVKIEIKKTEKKQGGGC